MEIETMLKNEVCVQASIEAAKMAFEANEAKACVKVPQIQTLSVNEGDVFNMVVKFVEYKNAQRLFAEFSNEDGIRRVPASDVICLSEWANKLNGSDVKIAKIVRAASGRPIVLVEKV